MLKKHWLSISLAVLALVAFIACSPQQGGIIYEMMGGGSYGVGSSGNVAPPSTPIMSDDFSSNRQGAPSYRESVQSSMIYPYPEPYPYDGNVPAKDTREFLKRHYNATLRTRDVISLTERVETTVRGHEGRVDNTSSSEKYGYVQFVVPASQFTAFRDEIESMVGSRFISVQTSAQNLLPQKQSIEERQKSAQERIDEITSLRQTLDSTHTKTVNTIQAELKASQAKLATLEASDPVDQTQIDQLSSQVKSLQSRLTSENASYTSKRSSYTAQLKAANSSLDNANEQDQDLLDDVETVQGTISIQWISLWQIARLYLPGYWIPALLALASIIAFMWESGRFGRRNYSS